MKSLASPIAAFLLCLRAFVVVAVRKKYYPVHMDDSTKFRIHSDDGDEKRMSVGQHWNLVDILGSLPPVARTSSSFLHVGRTWSTAVCSTGHLRTFGLPGMYSSLLQNLLNRNNTDLYLVGHFGAYDGSQQAQFVQGNIQSSDDASLRKALSYLGVDHGRMQLGASDCEALKSVWKKDGKLDRQCDHANPFKMQLYWVDHCVDLVKKSGKPYDVFVRTRPDVGVFAPMPWSGIDPQKVNFMRKDAGGKADYFFTVPMALLQEWWDRVLPKYTGNRLSPPDYVIFEDSPDKLHQTDFPAAIVRGVHRIECFRLVNARGGASKYRRECEQVEASGKFGDDASVVATE